MCLPCNKYFWLSKLILIQQNKSLTIRLPTFTASKSRQSRPLICDPTRWVYSWYRGSGRLCAIRNIRERSVYNLYWTPCFSALNSLFSRFYCNIGRNSSNLLQNVGENNNKGDSNHQHCAQCHQRPDENVVWVPWTH